MKYESKSRFAPNIFKEENAGFRIKTIHLLYISLEFYPEFQENTSEI